MSMWLVVQSLKHVIHTAGNEKDAQTFAVVAAKRNLGAMLHVVQVKTQIESCANVEVTAVSK